MNAINDALMRLLSKLGDLRGQTLAEYSIIITVVGVGVVVAALFLFRDAVGGTYDSVTACLNGGC